ncbi:MAG: hypothetical protein AAF703_08150 [Cyanobacteria bacterium P01_D01_bin.105]
MLGDLPSEKLSPENQDVLDDLLVAIEASERRLGIFIAVCDDMRRREQVVACYEQALSPQFRHYRLMLSNNALSLTALLRQQVQQESYLQQGKRAVISVLGAECLRSLNPNGNRSEQAIFLGYLQWTREALQAFPFPIVLWITYDLQKQLILKAPDFWSWRREVMRF